MRRPLLLLLLIAALALAASSAALAAVRASSDGTLSIRSGDGMVSLVVRGAIIGRLAAGTLEIEGPKDDDCAALPVFGEERSWERTKIAGHGVVTVCVYRGSDIRFRLVGGQQVLRIKAGRDVNLSAVGRGYLILRGAGGPADGTFSLNGGEYESLPDTRTAYSIGSP